MKKDGFFTHGILNGIAEANILANPGPASIQARGGEKIIPGICRILSVAVVAIVAVSEAHAGYYFNSLVGSPGAGPADGLYDGVTAMANSFYAPDAANGDSTLTLSLLRTDAAGSGSLLVYLVPDTGVGSSGVAVAPQFSADSFTNAQLIGSVADSVLTTSPQTYSFTISSSAFAAVQPNTVNDEYWIGILPSNSSVGAWVYNDASAEGTGYAGQSSWYYPPGTAATNLPLSPGYGPYEMSVAVPEPMSLAFVGIGLAGLGVARLRRWTASKAD